MTRPDPDVRPWTRNAWPARLTARQWVWDAEYRCFRLVADVMVGLGDDGRPYDAEIQFTDGASLFFDADVPVAIAVSAGVARWWNDARAPQSERDAPCCPPGRPCDDCRPALAAWGRPAWGAA